MPPNRFESEVGNFLEGSHGDRTHIKRAGHHTVTPLCGTLLYKTLPAQEKPPISAHLARAGRTFSRCRRKQPEQGESFPADHHPSATQRTRPGTKLSRHPPPQGQTGTKLSGQSPPQGQPVQNSPHTAKNTYSSPFEASRENFFPVQTQTTRAGRIFSRRPPHTSHAGHTHRYKTLRAIPASRPTGTKLSPYPPMRTRTLKVACNSITARIRAYSKALESQGSVIMARRTHWGIACETAERPEKWAHKTGPVIIHRPRLVCISVDASDYQARTERS